MARAVTLLSVVRTWWSATESAIPKENGKGAAGGKPKGMKLGVESVAAPDATKKEKGGKTDRDGQGTSRNKGVTGAATSGKKADEATKGGKASTVAKGSGNTTAKANTTTRGVKR